MVLSHSWVKPLLVVVVSLVVGWFILRFIGKISWSDVGEAVTSISIAELLALLGLLLLRQVLNSAPIHLFTPGLGVRRAVMSDLSANLAGTITPPPGDVVVRVAQFKTWGINPVDGMAGATLNMLIFYGARFAAPALGALVFCLHAFNGGRVVTGVVCLAIAVAIIGLLVAVLRSDAVAEKLAKRAAEAAKIVGAKVDEDRWVAAVKDFRERIGRRLQRGLGVAIGFMLLAIVVDALILLAAVRFVGLGPDAAPWPVVVGSMLLAYPLTILPAFGLGVMDAVVIASVTDVISVDHESALVGAAMVWRTVTIFGTLALGTLAMAWWRIGVGRAATRPAR